MLPLLLIGRAENRSQSERSCQGHKHPLDVGVLKPLTKALLLAIAKGSQSTWAAEVLLSKPQQLCYLFRSF